MPAHRDGAVPKAAERYRQKVADIHAALSRGEEGDHDAITLVRSLIGRVVVHATPGLRWASTSSARPHHHRVEDAAGKLAGRGDPGSADDWEAHLKNRTGGAQPGRGAGRDRASTPGL